VKGGEGDAHAETVFRFGLFDGFVGSATEGKCSCNGLSCGDSW
jgi:hypothetical protein